MAATDTVPVRSQRRRNRRLCRRSTSSGSPPAWAATATRSRSPPPRSRASRTSLLGAIPGLPKVHLHNPVLAYENGDDFMKFWYHGRARASSSRSCSSSKARSRTRRSRAKATGPRSAPTRRPASRSRPATGSTGSRRRRWPSSASGTCATYGGIHAMAGNPTGCMGLADYLGWDWQSKAGLPIVNVPGCPVQPDNFMETLLYLLYQVGRPGADDSARRAAAADVAVRQDRARRLRSRRLLRAGRLRARSTARPSASSSSAAGGRSCNCNVPKRGWMAGIGGCPNVGGICIGCTMPGFPDKFMPFMDEPPGAQLSSTRRRACTAALIRALRTFTNASLNKEPKWRHNASELTTGYQPTTYGSRVTRPEQQRRWS